MVAMPTLDQPRERGKRWNEKEQKRTDCHFQPTPQKQPGMIDLRPTSRQNDSSDGYTDDNYRQGKDAGECQLLFDFY